MGVNLDTDLRPPHDAIEATKAAIDTPEGNSWLPFTGLDDLKEAVAALRQEGVKELQPESGSR